MTFKNNWEKADQRIQLSPKIIEQMMAVAYPNQNLTSHEMISGGCANLNIKINLRGDQRPLILRIYLRDKDAGLREQKLAILVKQTVPVPEVYFVGEHAGYRFAITEFLRGITLRELLLGSHPHDLASIMHDVGTVLYKIQQHQFPIPGLFDKYLNVIPHTPGNTYISFALETLKHPTVKEQLGLTLISKIEMKVEKYGTFFPDDNQKNLVHADYDPANILVDKIDGAWKITGILDWEFAFSGSVLCDVANMLRYAHQMPDVFEESFLQGLTETGLNLPEKWRTSVHLLNMESLLDCLVRADPTVQPNQCADIRDLITDIIQRLDESL